MPWTGPVETPVVPDAVRELVEAALDSETLELPMLPTVASEILGLCHSPDVDARRLSEVLHRDQSLAGHVLRISNSAFYQASVPIVSLQQAISRLGLETLGEITVAVAMQGRVFRREDQGDLMTHLWRHSLAAGYFAKEIARTRRCNVESAFLCGLLHDVGKPIVASILFTSQEAPVRLPVPVLNAALDEFHIRAGSILAEKWELPLTVQESIRYHHDDYASAPNHGEAAMQTCLADYLAYLAIPSRLRRVDEQGLRAHDVLEALNLYGDELDAILAHTERVLEKVEVIS